MLIFQKPDIHKLLKNSARLWKNSVDAHDILHKCMVSKISAKQKGTHIGPVKIASSPRQFMRCTGLMIKFFLFKISSKFFKSNQKRTVFQMGLILNHIEVYRFCASV